MPKREECRKCGAKLKHDKTSDQYDPEYCSGKCRKEDGAESYVKSAEEQAMVVEVVKKRNPASYEDYKKNIGGKYARRFEPEKLNWSKNRMNEEELEQAGFRANREPIPGDWDYEDMLKSLPDLPPVQNEWQLLKAHAKELGIKTHGKKRGQIEAEIADVEFHEQEKENESM